MIGCRVVQATCHQGCRFRCHLDQFRELHTCWIFGFDATSMIMNFSILMIFTVSPEYLIFPILSDSRVDIPYVYASERVSQLAHLTPPYNAMWYLLIL